MSITPEEARAALAQADCLYDEQQLQAALDRIAKQITERLGASAPVVLCVMTGGLIPAGHLLTRLNFALQIDYVHATRYRGETSGGQLQWIAPPRQSLEGRSVLIVDDILDEGHTLAAIIEDCKRRGAREVYTAVLVNKLHERKSGVAADFVGVDVEDRYVFGFGMDYKDYLRNVPGIYAIKD